ncbi:MAG: hypothetical protein QG577_1078 [Thermodesulfobacteriota bacterium]|nr:hypothetical protein [Thermodesulfobacteriota bacterium]
MSSLVLFERLRPMKTISREEHDPRCLCREALLKGGEAGMLDTGLIRWKK